jgi:hypothetical protein
MCHGFNKQYFGEAVWDWPFSSGKWPKKVFNNPVNSG